MGKQLNPLEKEFLIRTYRAKTDVKLADFCRMNDVSDASMRKWMKLYDEGGLEGLSRVSELGEVLPEGVDRSEENYKREILKLRIENERLKKNYTVQKTEDGKSFFSLHKRVSQRYRYFLHPDVSCAVYISSKNSS